MSSVGNVDGNAFESLACTWIEATSSAVVAGQR